MLPDIAKKQEPCSVPWCGALATKGEVCAVHAKNPSFTPNACDHGKKCPECEDGECVRCSGDGVCHQCNHECEDCDGDGKCQTCGGSGRTPMPSQVPSHAKTA